MKLVFNRKFLGHENKGHPENAERLSSFKDCKNSEIENGEKYLSLIYSQDYIHKIKLLCEKELPYNVDTPCFKDSYETACYAVGASILAAKINGFALVRPPGHHAGVAHGGGFCLFNNIAIATQYLLNKGKRVFIVDFDLHLGDGTHEIFDGVDNVFYFSTQQGGIFPGAKPVTKNCFNVDFDYGVDDEEYIKILDKYLVPLIKKFKPDVVGLSAGFDSYYKDLNYLGLSAGFRLTKKSYERIKEIVSGYGCFAVLEGGYNPESIKEGVEIFIE